MINDTDTDTTHTGTRTVSYLNVALKQKAIKQG